MTTRFPRPSPAGPDRTAGRTLLVAIALAIAGVVVALTRDPSPSCADLRARLSAIRDEVEGLGLEHYSEADLALLQRVLPERDRIRRELRTDRCD